MDAPLIAESALRHGISEQPIAGASQVSAVLMPRSLKDILAHADELGQRFERHQPDRDEIKDAAALRALRQAALKRADTEAELADAVALARAEGHSWQAIGAMLGTSGEAARQRYGQAARAR